MKMSISDLWATMKQFHQMIHPELRGSAIAIYISMLWFAIGIMLLVLGTALSVGEGFGSQILTIIIAALTFIVFEFINILALAGLTKGWYFICYIYVMAYIVSISIRAYDDVYEGDTIGQKIFACFLILFQVVLSIIHIKCAIKYARRDN